jgi:anti-sigma regulatory factor (Ser/Thr protein kinase)
LIGPTEDQLNIKDMTDVKLARWRVRETAGMMGFSIPFCEEISLVVSELGTNLIKHAGGGTIRWVRLPEDAGIQIDSLDDGPGIRDPDAVMADGHSTSATLGYGLGAVNRLMDELEISPKSPHRKGAHIRCRRYVRREKPGIEGLPLKMGTATRAHPEMNVNGDAYVVKTWPGHALIGVIDGLGHGPLAAKAAVAAKNYVETHYDRPLMNLFKGVGRACLGTRGVVMALVLFKKDIDENAPLKMRFAGVGNVEVRVRGGERMRFTYRRGIIGLRAPDPVVSEHSWHNENILVMYSDGIRSHWQWEAFLSNEKNDRRISAQKLAQTMLHRLARERDDATIVVVKGTEFEHPH